MLLLCFLRPWTLSPDIPVDVGSVRSLPPKSFDGFPSLSRNRRNALVSHESVNSGNALTYRALNEATLAVPSADEDGVYSE